METNHQGVRRLRPLKVPLPHALPTASSNPHVSQPAFHMPPPADCSHHGTLPMRPAQLSPGCPEPLVVIKRDFSFRPLCLRFCYTGIEN